MRRPICVPKKQKKKNQWAKQTPALHIAHFLKQEKDAFHMVFLPNICETNLRSDPNVLKEYFLFFILIPGSLECDFLFQKYSTCALASPLFYI